MRGHQIGLLAGPVLRPEDGQGDWRPPPLPPPVWKLVDEQHGCAEAEELGGEKAREDEGRGGEERRGEERRGEERRGEVRRGEERRGEERRGEERRGEEGRGEERRGEERRGEERRGVERRGGERKGEERRGRGGEERRGEERRGEERRGEERRGEERRWEGRGDEVNFILFRFILFASITPFPHTMTPTPTPTPTPTRTGVRTGWSTLRTVALLCSSFVSFVSVSVSAGTGGGAFAFTEEPSSERVAKGHDGYCGRIVRAAQGPRREGYSEFRLRVEGDPESYHPGSTYRVTLVASSPAYFRGFTLIALKEGREGDQDADYAGHFQIIDEEDTQFMTSCPPAVTESTPRRRTSIHVFWTAPPVAPVVLSSSTSIC
ncbi:hypothetical protein CRUP_036441 [Coryphaenoides rupestris]|nr:hypothetical protein CRUP_036441 [Coryphaenoides rupestris]